MPDGICNSACQTRNWNGLPCSQIFSGVSGLRSNTDFSTLAASLRPITCPHSSIRNTARRRTGSGISGGAVGERLFGDSRAIKGQENALVHHANLLSAIGFSENQHLAAGFGFKLGGKSLQLLQRIDTSLRGLAKDNGVGPVLVSSGSQFLCQLAMPEN